MSISISSNGNGSVLKPLLSLNVKVKASRRDHALKHPHKGVTQSRAVDFVPGFHDTLDMQSRKAPCICTRQGCKAKLQKAPWCVDKSFSKLGKNEPARCPGNITRMTECGRINRKSEALLITFLSLLRAAFSSVKFPDADAHSDPQLLFDLIIYNQGQALIQFHREDDRAITR